MKNKQKSKLDLKKEKVLGLNQKLERAKTIFLTEYHGLTSEQLNDLRAKIKKAGGELLIIKNTLLKKALENGKWKMENGKSLEGPTATLLAYDDEIAPLKEIDQINKTLGFPTYKLGFFGNLTLDASQIETLAKLPAKEVLQGKVVGALVFPLYGIVGVLNANLRNLVYALNEIAKSKTTNA